MSDTTTEAQKRAFKTYRQRRKDAGAGMITVMLDPASLAIIERIGGGKTGAIRKALRIADKQLLNEGNQNAEST